MSAVATAGGLPTHLGKYEIVTPLASGGMARIYIGRSTGIGSFERHVVLKMILPEKANDPTAVQMFLDEARLAASLNHQNVAQVFEVGEDRGIHFLAMEYVHGQDLRALLAKAGSEGTRIPLELALTVVAGAAAGLDHAHERRTSDGTPMGIVHRDVSPSNLMIGFDGAVKLLDFGIAKATSRSVETQSGIIKGKFAYMAPEQCRGREVDRRSDVFSLGIILYEVTTQHRCFRADSDFDTMHRIVSGDIVRPTRLVQGYPQALEAIVMKALTVDASQRYQSAGLLLEAVERFAVAARMPLSTMSLGRFMREVFGDLQEPWLVSGRIDPPLQANEHTISNTNATGDGPRDRRSSQARLAHHEEAPLHLAPGGALAELSHGPGDMSRSDAVADWQAKGYPSMPASHVAVAMPRPQGRPSSPNLPPIPPQLRSSIARTSQGYTGASGLGPSESSYPHYQRPPDAGGDGDLQPGKRLLYIGLGVVLVGIIVLLAISIDGGGSDDLPPPRPPPSIVTGATPGSGETKPEQTIPEAARGTAGSDAVKPAPTSGPDAGAQTLSDESINIHIVTVPPAADVLLAGKVIGTTPLDTKIERGSGFGTLTVHRARFEDVTATIDLSGDYRRELTLVAVPEAPAGRPPIPSRERAPRPAGPREHNGNDRGGTERPVARDGRQRTAPSAAPAAPAKKCQPPERMNPYDTSCGGQPCPPCSK